MLVKEASEDRDKLSFALESRFKIIVDTVDTLHEANEIIKNPKNTIRTPSLLIYALENSPLAKIKTYKLSTPDIPVILCSHKRISKGDNPDWNIIGFARSQLLITDLFRLVEQFLQKFGLEDIAESDSEYVKIRPKILLSVCPLKGDIYIRLSDKKFLKLFLKGDQFEHADWQKYTTQKKVEYLYIRLEQCQEFIEKYRIDLETKLSHINPGDIEQALDIIIPTHETVKEMSKKMGFNKEVQALVRTQAQIAIKAMEKSPRLADLLEKLRRQNEQYISAHSTTTAFLACAIASNLSWGSETTFTKLNLAAFLHDIALDNQELAKCSTLEEAENGPFSAQEKAAFHDHTIKAAEIARNFTEVPPDVDIIILQHHEQSDMSGFPRGIGYAYISPLACIFIVAHEIAEQVLQNNFKFDLKQYIAESGDKYMHGGFKKVMQAIAQIQLESPSQSQQKTQTE